MEVPKAVYTSHLELYLIKFTTASLTSEVKSKCILFYDDKRMYDPMSPFPLAEVPADTDSKWEFYTFEDNKCGSVSLEDKYYKVVIDTSFPYTFVADIWGDRCFKNDATTWKLRYDEIGNPNACIIPGEKD
jgi:hypothetical protein